MRRKLGKSFDMLNIMPLGAVLAKNCIHLHMATELWHLRSESKMY